jgi:hypothetical protein
MTPVRQIFTKSVRVYYVSVPANGRAYFFSHGVRLSPLGTAATVWPILPAPDDR